jgi:hypothetical protein
MWRKHQAAEQEVPGGTLERGMSDRLMQSLVPGLVSEAWSCPTATPAVLLAKPIRAWPQSARELPRGGRTAPRPSRSGALQFEVTISGCPEAGHSHEGATPAVRQPDRSDPVVQPARGVGYR